MLPAPSRRKESHERKHGGGHPAPSPSNAGPGRIACADGLDARPGGARRLLPGGAGAHRTGDRAGRRQRDAELGHEQPRVLRAVQHAHLLHDRRAGASHVRLLRRPHRAPARRGGLRDRRGGRLQPGLGRAGPRRHVVRLWRTGLRRVDVADRLERRRRDDVLLLLLRDPPHPVVPYDARPRHDLLQRRHGVHRLQRPDLPGNRPAGQRRQPRFHDVPDARARRRGSRRLRVLLPRLRQVGLHAVHHRPRLLRGARADRLALRREGLVQPRRLGRQPVLQP